MNGMLRVRGTAPIQKTRQEKVVYLALYVFLKPPVSFLVMMLEEPL